MAREFNRELFGGVQRDVKEREASAGAPVGTPSYAKAEEVKALFLHVEAINKRLKEFESRVEVLNTKVEEVVTQNKQRFERVQGHFKSQTEMIKNGFNDVNTKIAHVVSRVNERKVSENVVKEMVERQASLVQNFEVRMQQLSRIISEQELQLMNARSELKEALGELSRLKKL